MKIKANVKFQSSRFASAGRTC